jgi:hypothetical protein
MRNRAIDLGQGDPVIDSLARTHGPLLGGKALWRALGYPSARAFSKALERKTVPVDTFGIPHRRGRFALTHDVVIWLRHTSRKVSEP